MNYYFHPESALQQYPKVDYEDFVAQHAIDGYWQHDPNVSTYYKFLPCENSSSCIVIFPGRAEAIVKYHELLYELHQNGHSVFIIDHRGQGGSSRMLKNKHIGYVGNFDDYVEDAKRCIDKVLMPLLESDNKQPGQFASADAKQMQLSLLCHSMGGAIGTLFVQRYPHIFTKVALSAPMFGIHMPLPEYCVKVIVKASLVVQKLFAKPISYFWGQGDYQPYPFITNRLTHSEARYKVFRAVMSANPNTQLGGISFNWLLQAIIAMQKLRKQIGIINIPVLVFSAEDEKIVDNRMLLKTAKKLSNVQVVRVANAQHEILFEQDSAKHFALTRILDFFARH